MEEIGSSRAPKTSGVAAAINERSRGFTTEPMKGLVFILDSAWLAEELDRFSAGT